MQNYIYYTSLLYILFHIHTLSLQQQARQTTWARQRSSSRTTSSSRRRTAASTTTSVPHTRPCSNNHNRAHPLARHTKARTPTPLQLARRKCLLGPRSRRSAISKGVWGCMVGVGRLRPRSLVRRMTRCIRTSARRRPARSPIIFQILYSQVGCFCHVAEPIQ